MPFFRDDDRPRNKIIGGLWVKTVKPRFRVKQSHDYWNGAAGARRLESVWDFLVDSVWPRLTVDHYIGDDGVVHVTT